METNYVVNFTRDDSEKKRLGLSSSIPINLNFYTCISMKITACAIKFSYRYYRRAERVFIQEANNNKE